MSQRLPLARPLALTMGDPAGIGAEIALGAWVSGRVTQPFFLIGDLRYLAPLATRAGVPVVEISDAQEVPAVFSQALPILPLALPAPVVAGTPEPANAPAVVASINRAVSLVQAGTAGAIVTNPINKKVLKDGAGFAFPGHTEYLAHLGRVPRAVMMLVSRALEPELRVVPVTIHIPLADVPDVLTAPLIEETVRITAQALTRDFSIAKPRLAVAGLNPHAGEQGAMGREEIEIIAPALERLRSEGLEIAGPMPADTMFHAPARARCDAVLTMYHDQGLIPLKALDFASGVNVTLGLPFIRTSPDHGTAYDIAGTGKADPTSLIEALNLATEMAAARKAGAKA